MDSTRSDLPVVALDLKTYTRKAAGVGRYCIELTQNLVSRGAFDYCGLVAPQTDRSLLPDLRLLPGAFDQVKSSLIRSFWALPRGLKNSPIDLSHSMDPVLSSFAVKTHYKRISTVHDMIVWKYPSVFTKKHVFMVRRFTELTLAKADHVITDSHSAKADILSEFPKVDPDRISVIHLAASARYQPQDPTLISAFMAKHSLPKRYFLSVGTNEPRKNLDLLMDAFDQFRKKSAFSDIGLALVGGSGWMQGKLDPSELNQRGIFPLGFLPEEELPLAYAGAKAFVYPSLYEGFGLPLLESMGCGVPVITSNISSMPEVAGDAGLYVDPHSIDSIRSAMEQMADQESLYEQMKLKALENSRQFTWEKTALQTESVYRSVLGKE